MRLLLSSSSYSLLSNPRKAACFSFHSIPMSWACKKCTYLNPSSQKSTCEICLSSSSSSPPPSSSSSPPKWSCKACTFLNPYKNSNCEVCDSRCPLLSLSNFQDLNDTLCDGDLDSSVGSVFFPLRPCKRKAIDPVQIDDDRAESGGFREVQASSKAINLTGKESVLIKY